MQSIGRPSIADGVLHPSARPGHPSPDHRRPARGQNATSAWHSPTPLAETVAHHAAATAAVAMLKAIHAFEHAGFRSQPIRDALMNLQFAIREVQS